MPNEWDKLRSWNGSKSAAFEELICQLASYENSASEGTFERKGMPDAGVECFWKFPSNAEHGWQAKFFTSAPNSSQWKQVDHSVKTALEKHPNLRHYTICMALDHPDSRREGATSSRDHLNAHVTKWEGWAVEKGMCVQFFYWGTHEIIERLSRDEHRGRHYFWFGEELLTPSWFQGRFDEVIAAVGPRYTPELNVKLPISDAFEGLSRSPIFLKRFREVYGDIGKAWSRGFLNILEDDAPEQIEKLYQLLEEIVETAKNCDKSGMDQFDWPLMEHQVTYTLKCISDVYSLLHDLDRKVDDAKSPQQSDGTGTLSRNERLSGTRHRLWRVREKLSAFGKYIKSDLARLANQPAMLLIGDAGTGKTHLFADAAKNHLESGCPSILLLGMRFTKEEPWAQILRMLNLSCNRGEFLGALEAAAERSGRRATIFIDALNEGEARSIWKTWLPSILECLALYPWIAIAVSVRSSYEELLIPDGLNADELVRCVHDGFAGEEYQAATKYFEYYNIQPPSVPFLPQSFRIPCFCAVYAKVSKIKG